MSQSRLVLWILALEEAKRLLRLAERASKSLNSQEVLAKDQRHIESAQAFARSQPDYQPGIQKLSHFVAHDAAHPSEFPDSCDCYQIVDTCQMLATIFFCQVFKSGYADQGNVEGNDRAFVNEHLGNVLRLAFPSEDEIASFDRLRKSLEQARDSMIAHADAVAFQVTRTDWGMHHRLHITALKGINTAEFSHSVEHILCTLHKYTFGPNIKP